MLRFTQLFKEQTCFKEQDDVFIEKACVIGIASSWLDSVRLSVILNYRDMESRGDKPSRLKLGVGNAKKGESLAETSFSTRAAWKPGSVKLFVKVKREIKITRQKK